jgi:hypothetical protein
MIFALTGFSLAKELHVHGQILLAKTPAIGKQQAQSDIPSIGVSCTFLHRMFKV